MIITITNNIMIMISILLTQVFLFEYYDYDMSTDNPNRYLEFHVNKDDLDTYYAKYPLTFKKIEAEYGDAKDRSSTALLMGGDRQRKARKLLFKILDENIETWWD